MSGRTSQRNWGTRLIHHEAGMYLLRLCADLKVQMDDKQPLRMDASRLDEWSTHRADFEKCETPITRYSANGHYHEGDMLKHADLLMNANRLIIELKLRNAGESVEEITWQQLEAIERDVMRLDCRKQVVFH